MKLNQLSTTSPIRAVHHTISALAVSIMLLSLPACTGGGGSPESGQATNVHVGTGTQGQDAKPERKRGMDPDPRGEDFKAKIIYNSPKAKAVPPFDPATYVNNGPMRLLASWNPHTQFVDIDDCGASRWLDGTRKDYCISIWNGTDDYLGIESIEVPDSRFEVSVRKTWYKSSAWTFIDMVCDTVYSEPDYRIIVNFKDDMYPPQALHINLHPDINRLRAEKLNGGDSQ